MNRDMETLDGEQPQIVQPTNGSSTQPRRKGPARPPQLLVRQGRIEKRVIDFDESTNPTGREKDKFISFLGYLARNKVGILWPRWNQVSEERKNMIWEEILVCNFMTSLIL